MRKISGCMPTAIVVAVAMSACAYGDEKPGDALPAAVADAVKAAYPDAQIRRIWVKENLRYGIMERYVQLQNTVQRDGAPWKYSMRVGAADDGTLISLVENLKRSDMPKAALDALKEAAGDRRVLYWRRVQVFVDEKLEKYDKPSLRYRVVVQNKDRTFRNIDVDEDGGMIEAWTHVKYSELPKAVKEATTKAAVGGRISSGPCEKWEIHVDEQMQRLAKPRAEYEGWLHKDRKPSKIRVSDEGKVIRQGAWVPNTNE